MPIYTADEMSVKEFTDMVRRHPVEFEPLPARFWEDERWLFEHVAEPISRAVGGHLPETGGGRGTEP